MKKRIRLMSIVLVIALLVPCMSVFAEDEAQDFRTILISDLKVGDRIRLTDRILPDDGYWLSIGDGILYTSMNLINSEYYDLSSLLANHYIIYEIGAIVENDGTQVLIHEKWPSSEVFQLVNNDPTKKDKSIFLKQLETATDPNETYLVNMGGYTYIDLDVKTAMENTQGTLMVTFTQNGLQYVTSYNSATDKLEEEKGIRTIAEINGNKVAEIKGTDNKQITRAEMAKMIYNIMNSNNVDNYSTISIDPNSSVPLSVINNDIVVPILLNTN